MVHELKCWSDYYSRVADGSKKFEVRKNDRGFKTGDILRLREFNRVMECYSDQQCDVRVLNVYSGLPGVHEGHVVMSIERCSDETPQPAAKPHHDTDVAVAGCNCEACIILRGHRVGPQPASNQEIHQGTDWAWRFENPRDAAAEIDKQKAEIQRLSAMLERLRQCQTGFKALKDAYDSLRERYAAETLKSPTVEELQAALFELFCSYGDGPVHEKRITDLLPQDEATMDRIARMVPRPAQETAAYRLPMTGAYGPGATCKHGVHPFECKEGCDPHICPHGMPLFENVCGICSQGKPNRPPQKANEPTRPADEIRDLACCDTFVRESASEFCATCGYTNLDHLRRRAALNG